MSKKRKEVLKHFLTFCHEAADALGISDGEFWVWYGNPFIIQTNSKK